MAIIDPASIVMISKAIQSGKIAKSGVKGIERGLKRNAPKPVAPANSSFRNVRTPSNTPGGMQGWQSKGAPKNPNPGYSVTFRKTKAHPEGVRRLVKMNPPKAPKATPKVPTAPKLPKKK